MEGSLTLEQLVGLDDSHVTDWHNTRLHVRAIEAFQRLSEDAAEVGFDLRVVSGYRSFGRQLIIFNEKATGKRRLFDDYGNLVEVTNLTPYALLCLVLRFSALPGASRHHWGSDIDIYDANAVSPDYDVQLSSKEVDLGGVFHSLHQWLDLRMHKGESYGFYRPYAIDSGGTAPERWHLSFAPLALECEGVMSIELIRSAWDNLTSISALELRPTIDEHIEEIFNRFVLPPPKWAPFS